jgi:FtsP/CotA-like multicopper oxidase with cupredoxin domain
MPSSPTDESKVPHYFGPYPNYANSPLTVPDVAVNISPAVTVPATVLRGNPLIDRSFATDYATAPGVLGPVFVVIPSVVLPAGTLKEFQTWNQATLGGSPTPSAGGLFHAYVLRPTVNPNEYLVVFDSGELTVPALADPAVSALATFPVAPGVAVQAGDVLGFYGEGIPVDVGGGSDILSYLATANPDLATPAAPAQGSTLSLGVDPGFPIYSQDRTYSFAATIDPTAVVDPGMGAAATATVDPATGAISGFTITNPGSGYLSAPTVSITSANGSNATATAVLNPFLMLTSITVDSGGGGYSAPAVAITGGGATTDATAHAAGGVDSLTITNPGSGFTQQPMVEISWPDDPAGRQATASATMDAFGAVDSITIVDPGSGYYSAPTVTITDGLYPNFGAGIDATATATLSITGITLDTFGSGYTSAPTIDITDTAGSGNSAAATAILTSGSISAINVGNPGSGYLTPGIKKFVDTLPGLGPTGANNLGQYIPVAVPDKTTYPGTDYYEIAVVQYRMKMHSSLPPTLLRGYVQLSTSVVPGAHVALSNANLTGPDTPINGYFGVDNPHYLGPTIVAAKDRPVRILFRNLLPTGVAGDLFLPVDTTVMGSGMGPLAPQTPPVDQGSVMDEVRNPMCNMGFMAGMPDLCYTQNRATLHLHGGITPWISDGTPHQWITPAGENTSYPEGVSVSNVPDMPDPGPGAQTFFYTNQQSARLMFYHDHAWGITRLNVYAGEAAGYVLTDAAEQALMAPGGPLAGLGYGIPLIIQDRTFVPSPAQLAAEDPTWDTSRWGGLGSLWVPHVMMPAQNPGSSTGQSDFGRWMYGPYFWPPATPKYGPIDNPYYDPNCDANVVLPDGSYQFCEPPLIPGVPNQSVGMEAFNDTPIVNGTAYPTVTLDPKTYRFRILNAANDRFWNLQWYVADSTGTEVALSASDLAAAQTNPDIVPQPDLARSPAGPDWIQIGTEGGFLPTPTVVSGHQPTTWIINPTRFDVGNVDLHSLLLAPAERGDVIVDFSKFAGKTLILYNDAPAAFPARVAGYDYYTGDPDMTGSGGAPTTLPGYGPNTRTIMQVKIAAKTAAPSFKIAPLNAAFAHHLVNGQPAGVFESSEDPIIVGQGSYNTAYGTTFRSQAPFDGFARINDMSLTFKTLLNGAGGASMTIPFENKGLHDEMNSATFDEYGRMSANLGLEAPGATPLTQNIILYPFINPVTEILDGIDLPAGVKVTPISSADDGTQIWKLTHNGVDTHPIHFHLFNVQLLNRVTWDNIIIPPDPNELGWKDTVRVSPLEDTIVALRPIIPKIPFGIPDSIRPLNPAMPLGDTSGFNQMDPLGNAPAVPYSNEMANFGWEYVWHCHILGHEEMDMMRPVKFNVPRALPDAPVLTFTRGSVILQWTDGTPVNYTNLTTWGNPKNETGFKIERAEVTFGVAGPFSQIATALANTTTYTDVPPDPTMTYDYRVTAWNAAGESASNVLRVEGLPKAPTNLTAVVQLDSTLPAGAQVALGWTNNATNAVNVVVERAVGAGAFSLLATLAPTDTSYIDTAVLPGSYSYRVYAVNTFGPSAYAGPVTVTVAQPGSTTVVLNSPNPSLVGENVTFTATVSPVLATGIPSGTVLFTANGVTASVALDAAGVATFSTATLPAGTYTITADYSGDAIFLPSTGSVTQTVNKAATTIVVESSLNPSNFGDGVIFTATVSSPATGTPSGIVTFMVNGVFISVPLNAAGVATFATNGLSVGAHTITADYSGDAFFQPSTGSVTQTVNQAVTTTDVVSSLNPSNVGQNVTFTASVSPAAAGTVTFNIDGIDVGTPTLSGGQATYSTAALAAGAHLVYATYNGDATYLPSTSPTVTQTVNNLTVTTTVVVSSLNPSGIGQNVTFTASVSPAAATGTVTFNIDGINVGVPQTLVGGQAAYSTAALAAGAHLVIAAYSGDVAYLPSTSAAITQTVVTLPLAPRPLNLSRPALSANPPSVILTWTDRSNNEAGFQITRATDAAFTTDLTTITVGANVTTFTDTTVAPLTQYWYFVSAFNAAGYTARAANNTATTTTRSQLPAVPAGLTVTPPAAPAGRTSLVVSWTYTSNGAPGPIMFDVQRSNTGTGGWTTVANNITPTTFTSAGLPVNTIRYYRVRAVNAAGNGAWTIVVSGRTLP